MDVPLDFVLQPGLLGQVNGQGICHLKKINAKPCHFDLRPNRGAEGSLHFGRDDMEVVSKNAVGHVLCVCVRGGAQPVCQASFQQAARVQGVDSVECTFHQMFPGKIHPVRWGFPHDIKRFMKKNGFAEAVRCVIQEFRDHGKHGNVGKHLVEIPLRTACMIHVGQGGDTAQAVDPAQCADHTHLQQGAVGLYPDVERVFRHTESLRQKASHYMGIRFLFRAVNIVGYVGDGRFRAGGAVPENRCCRHPCRELPVSLFAALALGHDVDVGDLFQLNQWFFPSPIPR